MKTLKEKIQEEFIVAFKAKDEVKKSALSMLKAKITEEEKKNKNLSLNDEQVLKVVISAAKQRKQSIEEFEKAGRTDLIEKERGELAVLEEYLPVQMSASEIESALKEILETNAEETNPAKKRGMTIGAFNKKYTGKADIKLVSSILDGLLA